MMKRSEMLKLASPKPCPFCGWGTIVDGSYLTGHSCACMSCGARTRKTSTWEKAVKLWNTRQFQNRELSVESGG